ncbi:MAG: OmpA family protein [Leucothrix sp.]
MKKILIILLALIALAVLGWLGVYHMKAPLIQADIKQRVGDALRSNSLDWVEYSVDGRDVTLSGVAKSQKMARHAMDTADIYGLNTLSNRIVINGEQTTNTQLPTSDTQSRQNNPLSATPNQTKASNGTADVAVQDVSTKGVAALPIEMTVLRDEAGEYIFSGTVPNMELKQVIDQHLLSIGADPGKAVWQVELSSAKASKNWQNNVLDAISTVQVLKTGEAKLTSDKAVIKGSATTQNASDTAEIFAQKLASDLAVDMNFSVVEPVQQSIKDAEEVTLVGSDKYAAKFCQTEFNALLKQQKIVFDSGSSNLQIASAAMLGKVSQVTSRCPNHKIQVHGYTDSQGAASANLQLSKVRAEAVVAYLVQKGIDKERLVAVGHGEKNPIATNKTKAGRAKNRRIKLIVKGLRK